MNISVTSDDKAAIYERLLIRQQVRRTSQLPALDIPVQYQKQIKQLEATRYQEWLQPHLDIAFSEIQGHPGVAGRLLQTVKAYRLAKAALFAETGLTDPRGKEPDMMALMTQRLGHTAT